MKSGHEGSQDRRAEPGRPRAQEPDRQQDVARGHDDADERDGDEVEQDPRQRHPVKRGHRQRQDADLGGQREGRRFGELERQPGQALQDRGVEEQDGQGRGVGQGEALVEELERIRDQDEQERSGPGC